MNYTERTNKFRSLGLKMLKNDSQQHSSTFRVDDPDTGSFSTVSIASLFREET